MRKVQSFCNSLMDRWMHELARLGGASPDPEGAYARYSAWLPFAHRANGFVRATAENLGYEGRGTTRES